MHPKAERLDRVGAALWQLTQEEYPSADLERMECFFEVVRGQRRPVNGDTRRALHPHLFIPGLSAQPWWDPDNFELAKSLQTRYELIAVEALGLLRKPWVFSAHPGRSGFGPPNLPDSPLEGRWLCYYLQRHLRRVRIAAEHAPVALRTLDGVPAAREALFSFLGPQSRIKRHSDKVNFVVTLYLPLFARGAWITFGGEPREWIDGRCMAADSTFYHESVNPGTFWRGLLLVDLWHPELTVTERAVLERAVPVINDILRSGDDD
jgi:aspartyl/asparaginyl beta-hydroxylase (cupin superfamily)